MTNLVKFFKEKIYNFSNPVLTTSFFNFKNEFFVFKNIFFNY